MIFFGSYGFFFFKLQVKQDQVNNADSAIIFLINHWSVGIVKVVEVVQDVQIINVVHWSKWSKV